MPTTTTLLEDLVLEHFANRSDIENLRLSVPLYGTNRTTITDYKETFLDLYSGTHLRRYPTKAMPISYQWSLLLCLQFVSEKSYICVWQCVSQFSGI
jgi:hypothetical protein